MNLAQTVAAQDEGMPRRHRVPALTTVERVLSWLSPDQGVSVPSDEQKRIIGDLITAVSGLVLGYINWDTLARVERTETHPSSRTGRIVLKYWPVLSVTSVRVSPATQDLPVTQYHLEPYGGGAQRLVAPASAGGSLVGDRDGVTVTYVSGFLHTHWTTVPAAPHKINTPTTFLGNEGVVLSDTNTLVGESDYTVSGDGEYTFGSGMEGDSVTLVYSGLPEDIEHAVVEEVGLAMKSRQRIGEQSKALPNGGGTSSYVPRALSKITMETLNRYRRVAPS